MSKADRKKFGVMEAPIPGTRVLGREMDSELFGGKDSFSLIVLNGVEGVFTSANVYGGSLGKNYDPSHYTHGIPGDVEKFVNDKAKKGYVDMDIDDPRLGGVVVHVNAESGVDVVTV